MAEKNNVDNWQNLQGRWAPAPGAGWQRPQSHPAAHLQWNTRPMRTYWWLLEQHGLTPWYWGASYQEMRLRASQYYNSRRISQTGECYPGLAADPSIIFDPAPMMEGTPRFKPRPARPQEMDDNPLPPNVLDEYLGS